MTGSLQTAFQTVETFARPRGVPEALELMHRYGTEARFVEGGTGLLGARFNDDDRAVRCLVDLTLAGLNYIRSVDGGLLIGATTALSKLENCTDVIALAGGLLAKAAAGSGSVQVRNRATIGGQLAASGPPPHILTPLLALDAFAVTATPSGARRYPLVSHAGDLQKAIRGGALLIKIAVPAMPCGDDTGWLYQKLFAPVAAGLQVSSAGEVKMARIAIGGVRALRAESLLGGRVLNQETARQAAEEAVREVSPGRKEVESAAYFRDAARFMIERALSQCAQKAGWVL
jgi:aerobic carbon-monoxide dehydrogenase medium subunit